jgi:P-type Ca2+ transporter type 2C
VTVPAGAPASTLAPGEDGPVWHTLRTDQVLQAEQVDGQHGLTSAEAAARVERFGLNTFDAGRVEPRWRAFVRQYADLMQLVLLGAGLVSLGLQQEGKAAAAVTALQTIEGKGYAADGPITRVAGEGEIPLDDFLLPMVLARAGTVFDADAGPVPVDGRARELYLAENQRLGEQGLRVLATARRDFDPATFDPGTDLLPLMTDLELLALVGIVDPPRPAAKASIATARKAGIKVRMITGDHGVTAAAIARQLGIDGTVITGAEFGAMSDDEVLGKLDDIGVIARVTPEHKVRLVDLLKHQGHIVAMTGDGVNDAPALKKADIGIAMGITGTEVTKEAAVMILTDDNFSTIVKAVELGRGLYDNLVKYVRFQMGCLFGFIVSFLGASIFNIAGGVPFLPLQTLWINFTTLLFQAIGLGYGQPAGGLMERRPRPPDEPILTRGRFAWLISVGLVMGAGTLGVISWADQAHTREIAYTMGVVTFSLYALFFSIATRDERRTVFSLDTFADAKFVIATGVSILTLLLTTVFGPLQAFLKTTSLDVRQWLICLAVALSIVVATEVRKAVRRHTVPSHPITR